MKLSRQKEFYFAMALALFTQHALADGGVGNINTFLEIVATVLRGIGVVTLTIAVMVAGYKIMYGGSTVREMAPLVIGGMLVGSATFIAAQLLG
jgi:type IV secretion system protein VirB2